MSNSDSRKKRRKGNRKVCTSLLDLLQPLNIYTEEDMYAQLWKEDWAVKCQREDMETVLQIERNKEMLDVSDRMISSM